MQKKPPLNKGPYNTHESEILNLMIVKDYEGMRFTLPQACAFLACIEEVSNFNPNLGLTDKCIYAQDHDVTGIGLCAWKSTARCQTLYNMCRKDNYILNVEDQIIYIVRELTGFYEYLMKTSSLAEYIDYSRCNQSSIYDAINSIEHHKFIEDDVRDYTKCVAKYFDIISETVSRRGEEGSKAFITRLSNRAVEYYEYYDVRPLYEYTRYSNNELIVFAFFMKNKFTLSQTCAFLSNIYHECGFNPDAVNDSEGAYGICQWRGNRFSDLLRRSKVLFNESLLSESNTPRIDIYKQLGFIVLELLTTEKQAYQAIRAYTIDSRDVAVTLGKVVADKYERSKSNTHEARGKTSGEFYDHYKDINYNYIDLTGLLDRLDSEESAIVNTSPAYLTLSGINPSTGVIESNLSRMKTEGYKYGYLIDNNTGEEFKFYVPEFSESAGASWNTVDIPGRSVNIYSYSKTDSRKINISLELYAGEGLYKTTSEERVDVVGKMHKDLNFVKSLEYPDYSNLIVRPPSTVHLILGSAVNMIGIVTDVSVEHMKPLDSQNRSMYAKLSFTVSQVSADPPGFKEIRNSSVGMISTEDPGSIAGD